MNIGVLLNLTVFALAVVLLARRLRNGAPLSTTVLLGLIVGAVMGAVLQWAYGHGDPTLQATMSWVGVIGDGYVRLLQMIVMPLVLMSILSAVAKLGDARSLGKISAGVLGVLLLTTAISAAIGIAVMQLLGLSADGLVQGSRELARGAALEARASELRERGLDAVPIHSNLRQEARERALFTTVRVDMEKVKAAYLLNFIRYTSWPESSFGSPASPIVLTIVGECDVSETLSKAVARSEPIGGRTLMLASSKLPRGVRQVDDDFIREIDLAERGQGELHVVRVVFCEHDTFEFGHHSLPPPPVVSSMLSAMNASTSSLLRQPRATSRISSS